MPRAKRATPTPSSTPGLSTVPIEIVSGFVGYISVSIPWHDLFNDYCKLTIKNVQVTIRTKSRRHPGFQNVFKYVYRFNNE